MKAFLSKKSQRDNNDAVLRAQRRDVEAEAKARMELGFGPPPVAAMTTRSKSSMKIKGVRSDIMEANADAANQASQAQAQAQVRMEGLQVPKKFSGRWSRFRRKSAGTTITNSSSIGNSSMDFWIYEVG